MISYKRYVLEKQSLRNKGGQRPSNLWKSVKILEYFKNNVPRRQIAKALQISSSTAHNINIQDFYSSHTQLYRI